MLNFKNTKKKRTGTCTWVVCWGRRSGTSERPCPRWEASRRRSAAWSAETSEFQPNWSFRSDSTSLSAYFKLHLAYKVLLCYRLFTFPRRTRVCADARTAAWSGKLSSRTTWGWAWEQCKPWLHLGDLLSTEFLPFVAIYMSTFFCITKQTIEISELNQVVNNTFFYLI